MFAQSSWKINWPCWLKILPLSLKEARQSCSLLSNAFHWSPDRTEDCNTHSREVLFHSLYDILITRDWQKSVKDTCMGNNTLCFIWQELHSCVQLWGVHNITHLLLTRQKSPHQITLYWHQNCVPPPWLLDGVNITIVLFCHPEI